MVNVEDVTSTSNCSLVVLVSFYLYSRVYTQHSNCGNDMCLWLAYISRFRSFRWQHRRPVTKFFFGC